MAPGENLLKSMQKKSAIWIYNRYTLYFLIFFLPFFIYLYTLAQGIIPEDSGELATAAFSLGIPHPPGYPLWIIVTKLFLFLPGKSIIFKANMASAFFSAAAVFFLFKLIQKNTKNFFVSATVAYLLAFSKIFWSQSIIAEVYSLNIFLVVLYLFFTEKTLLNFKYIKFTAFLSGLLIVSHYSNFLIVTPAVFILWLKYKKRLFKITYIVLGFFPLTLFFILLIRANGHPLINWGNPFNLNNLIFHILRLSFGSMISETPRSFSLFFKQLAVLAKMYVFQFSTVVGIIVAFTGLKGILKIKSQYKKYLYSLLLVTTSIGVVITLNLKLDEESFYINRVFFIPFFMLMLYISAYYLKNFKQSKILLLLPLLLLLKNYKYNDRAKELYTRLYNRNILKSINYKSQLFTAKDFSTFPLLYYTKVEYMRPDITIYDWFGNVFDDIFHNKNFHLLPKYKRDAVREKISDKIRLSYTGDTYYSFQRATLKEIKSLGIIYSYNKNLQPVNFSYFDNFQINTNNIKYMDYFLKNMLSVYYFHLGFFYKQEGDNTLSKQMFNLSNKFGGNKAKELLNLAVNAMKEKKFTEAVSLLKQAINSDAELDLPYLYLANILFQQGNYKNAEYYYNLCITKNRLNAMAYNNLGNLYLKLNNTAAAKNIFLKGMVTGYWKIYNNLAMIYIRENDLLNAEKILKTGINKSPDSINLYLNLSVVLSRLNKWQEAAEYLKNSLKINDNNYKIYLNLGLIYIKLNNRMAAKEIFIRGMKKFPDRKEFKFYYEKL